MSRPSDLVQGTLELLLLEIVALGPLQAQGDPRAWRGRYSRSVAFAHGSKDRLTAHDLGRFPGDSLFERLARAVCQAGCLPRKELYEAWEVARRTRRWFRGGRVVDCAAGHGLLAHVMLLLDDSSPVALAVDRERPPSSTKLHAVVVETWPRLAGRVELVTAGLEAFEFSQGDVVVSSHACGGLTDTILDRASAVRARVAVLPCCHDLSSADARMLAGWMDPSLAIDAARAHRLESRGYRIRTQTIAPGITPKARLLLGEPAFARLRSVRASARQAARAPEPTNPRPPEPQDGAPSAVAG